MRWIKRNKKRNPSAISHLRGLRKTKDVMPDIAVALMAASMSAALRTSAAADGWRAGRVPALWKVFSFSQQKKTVFPKRRRSRGYIGPARGKLFSSSSSKITSSPSMTATINAPERTAVPVGKV